MLSLLEELKRAIEDVARLAREPVRGGRRAKAYAAFEAAVACVQSVRVVGETEFKHFRALVWQVLLEFSRGQTIGYARGLTERLDSKCFYEIAVYNTVDFLMTHFFHHKEKYNPYDYRWMALRQLAKEHAILRKHEAQITSDMDRLPAPEASSPSKIPDRATCAEEDIFGSWHFGTMSRFELAQLLVMSVSRIEQVILDFARTFEGGRYYPIASSLIHLGMNGDIYLLRTKGLTAEQIGEKVGLGKWAVYKRLDDVRRAFARLNDFGVPGRKFGDWLSGSKAELIADPHVRQILHDYGSKIGLVESEFIKQAVLTVHGPAQVATGAV